MARARATCQLISRSLARKSESYTATVSAPRIAMESVGLARPLQLLRWRRQFAVPVFTIGLQRSMSSASSSSSPPQSNKEQQTWANTAANVAALEREELQRYLQTMTRDSQELRDQIRTVHEERIELGIQMTELQQQIALQTKELHELVERMAMEQVGLHDRVQRQDRPETGGQGRMVYRPESDFASRQPTHICELGHTSLAEMSVMGNHPAQRERLLREIMCADGTSWDDAHKVLIAFDKYNERYYWMESLPYRFGMTLAIVSAVGGTLMVFSGPIAYWYALQVAGEDLPDGVKDVNDLTVNQVGSWTWTWMEPMIGTASFVLLCCQFGRAQAGKMNMKSYGEIILQWRADRLSAKFPNYDRSMVRAWGKHMPRVGLNFFPVYESNVGLRGPTTGL